MAKKKKVKQIIKKKPETKKVAAPKKMVAKPVVPKKPLVYVCTLCAKEYKTPASLKSHKCTGQLEGGFLLHFKTTTYFRALVETISGWCDNCRIWIRDDKVELEASDDGKVGVVQVVMPKEKFTVYNAGKKYFSVVASLTDLNKIMKRGDQKDKLIMNYDANEQKIVITFQTESGRKRTFRIGVLDDEEFPEYRFEDMRSYEWKIYFNMDMGILEEIVKDSIIVHDVITLRTINKGTDIAFSSLGTAGGYDAEIGINEITNLMIDAEGSSSFFNVQMGKIFKLKAMVKELAIQTEAGRPLILTMPLNNGYEVLYAQAPRVEQEEYYDEDKLDETALDDGTYVPKEDDPEFKEPVEGFKDE